MRTGDILWQPSSEQVESTQMFAFMRAMAGKYGLEPEWSVLHQWSCRHRDCFWREMMALAGISRQGADFLRARLAHRRAMLYFTQPSTRTFLSFAAACQLMGIRYNEVRDPKTSSEIKGESEQDAVRVFSQYFDVIIMRHPAEGFVELTAHTINEMHRTIPIINGGAGRDQHPTQALLDIYTLYRAFSGGSLVQRAAGEHVDPFVGKVIAMERA